MGSDNRIRLYAGKVRVYHGTTLYNFNLMLKSGKLGQIKKGLRKKINIKTYATLSPKIAKQYANERAKLTNDKTGIVLSFIVDCDEWSGIDSVEVGHTLYKVEDIITSENYEYVFSCPIYLLDTKVHCVFKCN